MASRQTAIRAKCFRMGYSSRRNKQYYDRDLYREHLEKSQEQFNRILKGAQKQPVEAV